MTDYGEYTNSFGTPDFVKDPDSTEDYAFNWVADLDGDTISSSSFALPDGLTLVSQTNSDTVTQIFLSGGDPGMSYRLSNRIVTSGGRTFEKTVRIYVEER